VPGSRSALREMAIAFSAYACHPRCMPDSESSEVLFGAVDARLVGDATELFPSEVRDLSPWVLENLDELGRQLGIRLEATGTGVPVGTFRADIMSKDSSGRSVLIENQRGPSDHVHFGQIVIYALESKADVVIWLVAAGWRERMWGGMRREHRSALEQLNALFAGKIEFYGVELTSESETAFRDKPFPPLVPKLTVVARPNQLV
jgi:hypothetical protein